MTYFDLNIPHNEGGTATKPLPSNTASKNIRLKTVVKAMELGYTGVAYNRSMKGVMSDADRCSIVPFPLSSLLKAAPSLANTVKFHRKLLGVPLNSPFRQYTRLTVSVDSSAHAAALNSGNPVIKTYDLVAVRPLNQQAFDNACKVSEVDLIAIDFAEKLPFRLKQPLIKAAIERGIHFEITYSRFISDVQTRRQMVTNAKLLVDWTHGKNIIFSSAAASVNELRGPHDAANLSSLLGLSMERAKAAVSKNCRVLLAHALRKKQFFKDTIKVERILSDKPTNSKEAWLGDGQRWDNISSGEGDLHLEDIAKLFSACSKVPKTSKAIDFSSIVEEMPSKGMKLKDWLADNGGKLQTEVDTSPIVTPAKDLWGSSNTHKISEQSNSFEVPFEDTLLLASTPVENHVSAAQEMECLPQNDSLHVFQDLESLPQNAIPAICTNIEEMGAPSISCEGPRSSEAGVSVAVEVTSHDTPAQVCFSACGENPILPGDCIGILTPMKGIEAFSCTVDPKELTGVDVVSSLKDHVFTTGSGLVSPLDTSENPMPSKEIDIFSSSNGSSICGAQDVIMGEAVSYTEDGEKDWVSAECDIFIDREFGTSGSQKHCNDDADSLSDEKLLEGPLDEMQTPTSVAEKEPPEDEQSDLVSAECDMLINGNFGTSGPHEHYNDGADPHSDEKLLEEPHDEMQEPTPVASEVAPEEVSLEPLSQQLEDGAKILHQSLHKSKSGKKVRLKKRSSLGALPFPFKRLLSPLSLSRKKSRNSETK